MFGIFDSNKDGKVSWDEAWSLMEKIDPLDLFSEEAAPVEEAKPELSKQDEDAKSHKSSHSDKSKASSKKD
jgi:hypothetical protein